MRFLSLLITVFIDSLGFGLAFPIFSALIINPETSVLPVETSLSMRGWIFGLLISSFCVGQFFGGPILGALSDRKGRKKILLSTLLLSFATYALVSLGIVVQSVLLILLARLVGGWAGANWTIAQSIIVDKSTDEEKPKNFGLLGMAWGSGFVIGPFLGGKLAVFGLTTPFLIAAVLCLSNFFLLLWSLEETLPSNLFAKISLLEGVQHLKKAFTTPKLRSLFIVMFIFNFGWGFFTEFSPIFLIEKFHFSLNNVAHVFAWVGLWIALSQGLLIRPFVKRFAAHTILPFALGAMAISMGVMLCVKEGWGVFAILPIVAFFDSLIGPTASTLVSNLSAKEAQGEILGIHNSIQWAAIGFAPLFSGSLVAMYPHLPVTVATVSLGIAMLIFLKVYFQQRACEHANHL